MSSEWETTTEVLERDGLVGTHIVVRIRLPEHTTVLVKHSGLLAEQQIDPLTRDSALVHALFPRERDD